MSNIYVEDRIEEIEDKIYHLEKLFGVSWDGYKYVVNDFKKSIEKYKEEHGQVELTNKPRL